VRQGVQDLARVESKSCLGDDIQDDRGMHTVVPRGNIASTIYFATSHDLLLKSSALDPNGLSARVSESDAAKSLLILADI
jgi:hypothetical protein